MFILMSHIFITTLLIIFIVLLFIKILEVKSLSYREKFANVSKCHGKKDGEAGCRTCCEENYTDDYFQCVYECM